MATQFEAPYFVPKANRVMEVNARAFRGEQNTDSNGVPLWEVILKIPYIDKYGDEDKYTLTISVASQIKPALRIGEPAVFEGVTLTPSYKGDTVYFNAKSVEPADFDFSDVIDGIVEED